MGISSAMAAGVMGLSVNSSKLSAISDNIANSETKGYKRADVEFNAMVLNERPTSYDAGGVRASTTRYIDDQGGLTSTTNATDIAISGRGFLPVADIVDVNRTIDPAIKLTRTGSFTPDAEGLYRTQSGQVLMGLPALPNGGFAIMQAENLKPVKLDGLRLAAQPTTRIQTNINLNSNANGVDIPDSVGPLPLTYYDELGNPETLDLQFDKNSDNNWTVTITDQSTSPAEDLGVFTLNFAPDSGDLASVNDDVNAAHQGGTPGSVWTEGASGLPDPAAPVNLTLTSGQEITLDISSITQVAKDSQLLNATRDGAPPSLVVGVEVGEDGVMEAIYDSGERQAVYKIPVANVQNPNAMRALDGSSYETTRASGDFFLFEAGEGPTGMLVANALEESTTDVAEELTSLIKTQRAYSSNAKIIQTVDEMLQETTNLKR